MSKVSQKLQALFSKIIPDGVTQLEQPCSESPTFAVINTCPLCCRLCARAGQEQVLTLGYTKCSSLDTAPARLLEMQERLGDRDVKATGKSKPETKGAIKPASEYIGVKSIHTRIAVTVCWCPYFSLPLHFPLSLPLPPSPTQAEIQPHCLLHQNMKKLQ